MKYSQLSDWIGKRYNHILFGIFITGWSVSTYRWLSYDPFLEIWGIIFYFTGLFYPIFISFLVRWKIPYLIKDNIMKKKKFQKTNQSLEDRHSADSRNFTLLHGIFLLVQSLIMTFCKFSYTLYIFVLYLTLYFSIAFVFLFLLFTNKQKIISLFLSVALLIILEIVTIFNPIEQYSIIPPIIVVLGILIPPIFYKIFKYFQKR